MGPGAEPVGADLGVSWVDGAEDLVEAFTAHLGKGLETVEETLANLALHGIVFDAEEVAWVGAADLAVAALRSTLAAAAGRNPLEEPSAAQLTTAAKSVPAVPAGTDYHAVDYAGAVDSVNT